MRIYDITNPYDVSLVGSQTLQDEYPAFLGDITELAVAQNDFYVADGRNGIMHGTWNEIGGAPDTPQTTTIISNNTIYQNTTVSSGTPLYQNTTVTEVTTVQQTTTVLQSANESNTQTSNDRLDFNMFWFLLPVSVLVINKAINWFGRRTIR